jgi:replicative DNA helicase
MERALSSGALAVSPQDMDMQGYEPVDYGQMHDIADDVVDDAPHSMEAEQALLGAIMYDNAIVARVRPFLPPSYFYNPIHERIYASILEDVDRGNEVTAITLKSRFAKDDELRDIGGVDYLALLLEQAPASTTAGNYAKLIADYAARRKGLVFAGDLSASLADPNGKPAKQLLFSGMEALRDLARVGVGKNHVETPQDALTAHLDMTRNPSLSSGFKALDRVCRLDRGALTILAGKTSMGKSAFAVEVARRSATRGDNVYFLSLEMDGAQIAARMVSSQMAQVTDTRGCAPTVGVPYRSIVQHHTLPPEMIGIVRKEIQNLPNVRVDAKDSRVSITDILARVSDGDAPDLLVVDYLSKVEYTDMDSALRYDQKIGRACNRLRDFAKDTGCSVMLLVQLKRNGADEETQVPSLEDLRDSGEIEQAADSVWFVHRPAYFLERKEHRLRANGESLSRDDADMLENVRRDFTVIVAKQRMGGIGTAHLRADIAYNFIYESPNQ